MICCAVRYTSKILISFISPLNCFVTSSTDLWFSSDAPTITSDVELTVSIVCSSSCPSIVTEIVSSDSFTFDSVPFV